jgi:hypothetical protein
MKFNVDKGILGPVCSGVCAMAARPPTGVIQQMSNVRLTSTAATRLRMGAPIGAPDAGDLCPS